MWFPIDSFQNGVTSPYQQTAKWLRMFYSESSALPKIPTGFTWLACAPSSWRSWTRYFENISEKAWKEWQNNQTMLINEHRLSLMDPDARKFLTQKCIVFLITNNMRNRRVYSAFKLTALQYFCSIRGLLVEAEIAQLVEQRIENPRVGGSIPSLATTLSL